MPAGGPNSRRQAGRACGLDDAGLQLSDVDGLFAAGMGMGMMGVVQLSEYLDMKPNYIDGTNIGGSSFVAHVNHAAAAIHAGMCEVALILYGSTAASNAMAIGTGMGGGTRDPNAAFTSVLTHRDRPKGSELARTPRSPPF